MGDLVESDDGLPAEEVGEWAKEKHLYLLRYIDISRSVRAGFISKGKAGATYIDPFCGPGRSKIKNSITFIDGGAVAAWKTSVAGGSPFSRMLIADSDPVRLKTCEQRLLAINAPVVTFPGEAVSTIQKIIERLNPAALHCAFLDPFNLEALDFSIIDALSRLKRIDILVHVSQMDLQRNLGPNIKQEQSGFDAFAPGWRDAVNLDQSQVAIRSGVLDYWRNKVTSLGVWPSPEMRLITGAKNQPLYWLLLAAKHRLAHNFWATASNPDGQGSMSF